MDAPAPASARLPIRGRAETYAVLVAIVAGIAALGLSVPLVFGDPARPTAPSSPRATTTTATPAQS